MQCVHVHHKTIKPASKISQASQLCAPKRIKLVSIQIAQKVCLCLSLLHSEGLNLISIEIFILSLWQY